jgi:hypothetical protein
MASLFHLLGPGPRAKDHGPCFLLAMGFKWCSAIVSPSRHTDTPTHTTRETSGRVLFPTSQQPQPVTARLSPSLQLGPSSLRVTKGELALRSTVPGLPGGGPTWRYLSTINLCQSLPKLTTFFQPQISIVSSPLLSLSLHPCPFNPSPTDFLPTLHHPLFFKCEEKGRRRYSPGSLPIHPPSPYKGKGQGQA